MRNLGALRELRGKSDREIATSTVSSSIFD
jgi:hypothetical protein